MDPVYRWLTRVPAGPVLAAAAILGLWAMSVQPDALARVPELRRLSLETAQAQAAAAGYPTRVVLRPGPGRAGTVLQQRPEPHSFLEKGAPVELSVTRGARQIGVPDVRGMPVDEARSVLRQAELEPGDVTYRRSAGSEPNRVISTHPPPGATVDAGTPVDLEAAR